MEQEENVVPVEPENTQTQRIWMYEWIALPWCNLCKREIRPGVMECVFRERLRIGFSFTNSLFP